MEKLSASRPRGEKKSKRGSREDRASFQLRDKRLFCVFIDVWTGGGDANRAPLSSATPPNRDKSNVQPN